MKKSNYFKSKKITKYKILKIYYYMKMKILFLTDIKGNINYFSINKKKKLFQNLIFIKKNIKKLKKKFKFNFENNIIYVSDNIGYLYAYNYKKIKLIWAKNYKNTF